MASEAAKTQSHFYCPIRRRYIGPLPSCSLGRSSQLIIGFALFNQIERLDHKFAAKVNPSGGGISDHINLHSQHLQIKN